MAQSMHLPLHMINTMDKPTSSRTILSLIQRRLGLIPKDLVNTDMTINNKHTLSTNSAQYPVQIPKIPRQAVVDELFNLLQKNHEVLLYGPAHWGKSYLVEHNVPEDQNFRSEYDTILYLDLFTLRMTDPQVLEREIVWWLIQDSDKFEDHLQKNYSSKESLLHDYFQQYFRDKKALLVIDHLELLPDIKEIHAWVKKLRQFLCKNNIDTIWVDLCFSAQQSRLSLWSGEIQSTLEPPCVSEVELKDWLTLHNMAHMAESAYSATGGNVTLIRDFFVYAINKNKHDAKLVDAFITFQADFYSRSCHYILQAIKRNPAINLKQWRIPTTSNLKEAYRLSGVYKKDGASISIASKVHEHRLERLLTVDNLLLAGATLELDDILRLFNRSKLPHELATELMTSYLLSRNNNEQVFDGLKQFMSSLHKFQCEFYFQESHRLIWFSVKQNTPMPQLVQHLPARFQEAIWSGAPQIMQNDHDSLQLFIPVVGASGGVELIVSGLIPPEIQKLDIWRRDLYIRKIWHVFQSLHPVLMRAVESYTLRLSQRQFRTQMFKLDKMVLREDRQDELALLHESKSTAMILLKRVTLDNNQIRWVPRRILILPDNKSIPKELFLEDQNSEQLDNIDQREGAHGLVMEDDKAFNLFPKIETVFSNLQLYIKPIRVEKENATDEERELALFLFSAENSQKTDVISSAEQQYLSILAHRLAQNEYLKQLWRRRDQEEISLLNDIGFAMAKALCDPVEAQDSILHALQDYFNVEAISINDIVEMENGQKEVHFRRGVGYSPGYEQVVFTSEEGKTWLIDHEHFVIVSWKTSKNENEPANFYLDKEGTLVPYSVSISGRDQCSNYLPSGEVKVLLAAPILFQDLQSEKETTIGILKLVNRTGKEHSQIFSDREADSAGRIARLLAPVLYMLQNPDRYGLERRIKLMRSMFHAIGHEFRNPLNIIGGSAETALYDMDKNAELYPELSAIYQQKQHITQAIDTIEQLANQEPGHPVAVDLTKVIAQAWLSIVTTHGEKKIAFTFKPPAKPVFVKIDQGHFTRALENIFKNAVEILQPVESPKIVVSYVVEKGGLTRIIILDNVPGLAEDKISWIFEPFNTSHEGKFINGVKLRGIGLALARIAIENAGGKIYCKNNHEAGASFFLEIPSC